MSRRQSLTGGRIARSAQALRRLLGDAYNQDELDIVVQLPNHELKPMKVPLAETIFELKAAIQLECNIPFFEQDLYYGDDRLEDDQEIGTLNMALCLPIRVTQTKVYRSIGIPGKTIKTFVLEPGSLMDYKVIEKQAPLPPFSVIVLRLVRAIRFLFKLDKKQQKRTQRPIFRFEGFDRNAPTIERLLPATAIQALRVANENRSRIQLRQIKSWMQSLKYFIDVKISDKAMMDICKHANYHQYSAGQILFNQGDRGRWFYIILSGYVALSASGCGYLVTLGPGACFGEMSLFNDEALRTASGIIDYRVPKTHMLLIHKSIYRRSMMVFKQKRFQENERFLRKIPQFQSLTDASLVHLIYCVENEAMEPKRIVFTQGQPCTQLYLLVKGTVKLKAVRDIKQKQHDVFVMDALQAPKVFGQEYFQRESNYFAFTLETISKCVFLYLRPNHLNLFVVPHATVFRDILIEHELRVKDIKARLEVAHTRQEASIIERVEPVKPSVELKTSNQKTSPRKKNQRHSLKNPPKTFRQVRKEALHASLPFTEVLSLEQQLQYFTPDSPRKRKEIQDIKKELGINSKASDVLQVLRQIPPVPVQLVQVIQHDSLPEQFTFLPVNDDTFHDLLTESTTGGLNSSVDLDQTTAEG